MGRFIFFVSCFLLASTVSAVAALVQDEGSSAGDRRLSVHVYPLDALSRLEELKAYVESGVVDPKREAELSLAVAADFVRAGDIDGALVILRAARKRLATLSGPRKELALADIERALARVAWMDGRKWERLAALKQMKNALEAVLGVDHREVLRAKGLIASAMVESAVFLQADVTNLVAARRRLERIRKQAARIYGENDEVAVLAELSILRILIAGGNYHAVAKRGKQIWKRLKLAPPELRAATAIVLAQNAYWRGVAAEFAHWKAVAEQLLPADEVGTLLPVDHERAAPEDALRRRNEIAGYVRPGSVRGDDLSLYSGSYVDVSYCVDSEGHVTDLAVINSKGTRSWVRRMVEVIKAKEFVVGADIVGGAQCLPRYERYLLTSDTIVPRNSHIAGRSFRTFLVQESLMGGDAFRPQYIMMFDK